MSGGWRRGVPGALFPVLGVVCAGLMDWDIFRARVACHSVSDPALAYLGLGGWLAWVLAWSVPAVPLLWARGRGVRVAYWADAVVAFGLLGAVFWVEAVSRAACNEWRASIVLLLGEVYLLNLAAVVLGWGVGLVGMVLRR